MKESLIDNFGQEYRYSPTQPLGGAAKGGFGTLFPARKEQADGNRYVFKLITYNSLLGRGVKPDPFMFNAEIVKFEELLKFRDDISGIDEICFPLSYVPTPPGYIMKQINDHFKELGYLIQIGTSQKRLDIASRLMRALAELHEKGYHYGDVNPRNFMYDPRPNRSGFLVIDCDTIGRKQYKTTMGFPGYRDPLRILGISSDVFRAAKLVFKLISGVHPFEDGRAALQADTVEEMQNDCDAGNYPFILNTGDESNKWDPSVYTERRVAKAPCINSFSIEAADLFNQMFVAGLKDANARPQALEFALVLHRSLLRFTACATCGFYVYASADGGKSKCQRCGAVSDSTIILIKTEAGTFPVVVGFDDMDLPAHLWKKDLKARQMFESVLKSKCREGQVTISACKSEIKTFHQGKPFDGAITLCKGDRQEFIVENAPMEVLAL